MPSVDPIIIATPTGSQVKYAQAVGRGLRPFPGKSDYLVIDVAGVRGRLALQTPARRSGLLASGVRTAPQRRLQEGIPLRVSCRCAFQQAPAGDRMIADRC